MGQQNRSKRGAQYAGQRRLRFESVLKVAVVAALAVQALDLGLILLRNVVRDNIGNVDFLSLIRGQLTDIISQGALFGAVVGAYLGYDSREYLLKLVGLVFAASFLEGVVDHVLVSILNSFSPTFDILVELINATFLVTTFLGIVIALRLFQGKTIFPGIDFRL